jgi:hypothetical protein
MPEYMEVENGAGRTNLRPVNYPANSKKSKEAPPEKKVDQVTTGTVTQRKRPLASKVGGNFVSEGLQSVAQYVFLEVLVPAAKNMMSDAVSQGVDRFLFGDSRGRSSGTRPGYTNYNRATNPSSSYSAPRELSRQSRATHDFDEIILATRGEAEDVIDNLRNLVDQYQTATVADLYDLVGITGSFTDAKWGWDDLRTASVRHIRNGYLVVLPKTQPID